jgi:hypothetical protein
LNPHGCPHAPQTCASTIPPPRHIKGIKAFLVYRQHPCLSISTHHNPICLPIVLYCSKSHEPMFLFAGFHQYPLLLANHQTHPIPGIIPIPVSNSGSISGVQLPTALLRRFASQQRGTLLQCSQSTYLFIRLPCCASRFLLLHPLFKT